MHFKVLISRKYPVSHDGGTLGDGGVVSITGVVVIMQFLPSPVKPDLHLHVKPPSVLVQVASA